MATTTIGTGAAIVETDNDSDASGFTVISDTSAIATGNLNAGTVTALTRTTSNGKVSLAKAVLDVQMNVSAGDGKVFHLYLRELDINSTNDAPIPVAGTYEHTFVGSFIIKSGTTRQYIPLKKIPIEDSQEFYIKNDTGQSTTGTTVVKILPQSYNTK